MDLLRILWHIKQEKIGTRINSRQIQVGWILFENKHLEKICFKSQNKYIKEEQIDWEDS